MRKLVDVSNYTPKEWQPEAIKNILKNRYHILGDDMGCISGGSLVKYSISGCSRTKTFRDFYNYYNFKCKDPSKIKIRSFNGERFQLHSINKVLSSGIKSCLKVTLEDGKSIVLTPDHEVMTSVGFVEAQFLLGKEVMVDNLTRHMKTKGQKKPKNRYLLKQVGEFYPFGHHTKVRGKKVKRCETHILIAVAAYNGVSLEELVESTYREDFNYTCFDPSIWVVHHLDHDHKNNDISNLQIMYRKAHESHHGDYNKFKHGLPEYSKVISVTDFGEIDTYDIACDDPHRNFVADGILVHNCGKTFEFIAAALILNQKTVVMCPAYLKYVWVNEIKKVCKNPEDVKLFRITSYSKSKDLLQVFKEHEATNFGCDEAHYLKNMKAQRTINTFEAIAEHGLDRIVLMSGTPIKNRITEWYALLRLIHWHIGTDFLEKFPTEWNFSVHFCFETSFVIKGKKGSRRVTKFSGLKSRRRPELLGYVRPYMTRRLAKNVLGLAEPTYIHVEANTSDQYDEELLEAFLGGKDSTAKRKSALSKVPFTTKFLKDLADLHKKVDAEGNEKAKPIVVFTDHPEVAKQLAEKFVKSETIVGETPINRREGIVARFQQGLTDYLFCTIGAASTGHTMTATNIMVLNDMSHVAGDNDQAVRRVSRLGQTEACLVYCIGGSKVDGDINRNLDQKIKDLQKGM